jgi:hypothetical protein
MSSKQTPVVVNQNRQAVYFYPENQVFKVDEIAKQQLNNPVLLFTEQYPGHHHYFFKQLAKVSDTISQSKLVRYSLEDLQKLVAEHSPYNIEVNL